MDFDLKTLADEALRLPPDKREALTQMLIASINDESEVEAAWAAEIERRADELDNGSIPTIPLADALAHLRARIK